MAISTLVIGLGGTGVLTIRALKGLYNDLPEEERIPASFLAMDFDYSAKMSGDAKGRLAKLDDAEFIYLNPKGIQDLLRNLDRADNGGLAWGKILEWFPERSHVQIPLSEVESNGASQLRVLGRLGFFLNDEAIEVAIRRQLNQLGSEVDPSSLSEEKRVILVSSVAGGTGAGMLIDMAYIARRLAIRPRIWAYLLLPEVFEDVDSGGRIFQNAYACLKELAYLKEQVIPFQAEYYRIAPVDVPVFGEEPFARIFLARGDGFSGTDAIQAATAQMAGTILAQLQRTIQEKTLAIVSNTLSASAQEEQRRRRTHSFSAASSVFKELIPLPATDEALLDLLSRRLKDPAFLERVMARDVKASIAQLQERIGRGGGAGEKREAQEEHPPAESVKDEQVKGLLDEWKRSTSRSARVRQQELIKGLSARLDRARALACQGRRESTREAAGEVAQLEQLILADRKKDKYEDNLPLLKGLPGFDEFDQDLKEMAQTFLKTLEGTLGTEENLKRKAFYSKINKFDPRLWVRFPDPGDEEREACTHRLADIRAKLGDTKGRRWWHRFTRVFLPSANDAVSVLASCDILQKAFNEKLYQDYLESVFTVRALNRLKREVERNLDLVEKDLASVEQVWMDLPIPVKAVRATQQQEETFFRQLEQQLPSILDEARFLIKPDDDPETRREKLLDLLRRRVESDPSLPSQQYEIDMSPDKIEDWFREQLVRSRQRVFERRTPNPQRKAFTLIMIPQGLLWPFGKRDSLKNFLEASASQILSSRAQVEYYGGSRLWIYSEDLFNPPEHIRNMDEYFRTYDQQKYKELFHIDRRMLSNPVFRDINSSTSRLVVHCGNPGCVENLATVPRSTTVCPFCGLPIRSRCGNPACTANDLDRGEGRYAKVCPSCGGYNHAAWWRCCNHGKIEVDVPIDKERCPRCIEEHQKDPIAWPLSRVSVRPDLLNRIVCPHCVDLREKNPLHKAFEIPKDLLRFYRDGVNGHDRKPFLALAERYHMPGKIRCPNCRTFLIPFNHERVSDECQRRVQP
jgi:hypothetical protein